MRNQSDSFHLPHRFQAWRLPRLVTPRSTVPEGRNPGTMVTTPRRGILTPAPITLDPPPPMLPAAAGQWTIHGTRLPYEIQPPASVRLPHAYGERYGPTRGWIWYTGSGSAIISHVDDGSSANRSLNWTPLTVQGIASALLSTRLPEGTQSSGEFWRRTAPAPQGTLNLYHPRLTPAGVRTEVDQQEGG